MIINITPHCTLNCPHCMQCAGPERTEFMSREVFQRALDFARNIGSRVLLISGGEPTSHPLFLEFLKAALDTDLMVTVLSNGTFVRDHAFTERFAELVKDNSNFSMQVTSIKGLYANYEEMHKPNLKALRLFGGRTFLCDENNTKIQMKPLGRAAGGPWYEEAKRVNGFPSCANACLILAQFRKTEKLGEVIESTARFCSPMVSWDGSIRMGESEQCRVVANVSEPLDVIVQKIYDFRPCGGCASYKWHFEQPSTLQEIDVCRLLWPNR